LDARTGGAQVDLEGAVGSSEARLAYARVGVAALAAQTPVEAGGRVAEAESALAQVALEALEAAAGGIIK